MFVRFIPAGAGNTHLGTDQCGPSSVHPRGCGEHCLALYVATGVVGSSPRVRGTLVIYQPKAFYNRFIPAGAGNTSNLFIFVLCCSVHPRGCGEHPFTTRP